MFATIRRYVTLYGALLRFSLAKGLQFRLDGLFRVVMDVCFYAVSFLFFEVLYQHSHTFGGLQPWQARIFIATYLLVDAFRMTFFVDNFWELRHMVAKGGFDHYLTKPVSPLFLITMKDLVPASIVNIVIASALLVWSITSAPMAPTVIGSAGFITLLCNAITIFYILQLFTSITTFWTGSPDGLEPLFYIGKRFAERPHNIFPPLIRGILLTLVPYGLVASVPTLALHELDAHVLLFSLLLPSLGVTVILGGLAYCMWALALRNYSSASS